MADLNHLRKRYHSIFSSVGAVLVITSLITLSPLLLLLWRPEESELATAFLIPALAMAILGLLLWRLLRVKERDSLSLQEGGVIVVLSWTVVCVFSAFPFMLGMGMGFRQGLFESVSGWTTTGLSMVDESATPAIFLLWRSTMQLAGGAGLAIIMLSSIIGPAGATISVAEGREQLLPQVRRSATLILQIYTGYILAGSVALRLAGMSWFDAINHAFCALSTGGFSTRPQSIGYWDSVAVEAVTIPLMFLGNLSFVTAWAILRGRLRAVAKNGELRTFAFLALLAVTLVLLLTTGELYEGLGNRFRVALFNVVSALTTTGYATVDLAPWNGLGILILLLLMFVGGGTVSTAGGIKQFRLYLLWRTAVAEIRSARLPQRAVVETPVWIGAQPAFIDEKAVRRVASFMLLYFGTFLLGVGVMSAYGHTLRDSLFEYASTIGTVGLSIGVTSPESPAPVHWVQIAGMLLGRLEFFVVISGMVKILRDGSTMLVKKER